jgi:hypothetical protein
MLIQIFGASPQMHLILEPPIACDVLPSSPRNIVVPMSCKVKMYKCLKEAQIGAKILLKVRFHHHIFATNLMTNSLAKLP